jgi:N-acetylglucosaminyl-diphospho-decaprenol L-rhamnosyltransferase
MDTPRVTAVIVTHNSPPIVSHVVEALLHQSVPIRTVAIVDSGSGDTTPAEAFRKLAPNIVVTCCDNIGFAAANNLAMRTHLAGTDYFLLVNPDAVLTPDWVSGAIAYLAQNPQERIGILSCPLRGMDVKTAQPTGLWDSLGVYRHWTGRWHDRGQYVPIDQIPSPSAPYEPTAIVGALMFFSADVYRAIASKHGFFDERLITFKEDIEVSLRVHRAGYRLVLLPQLTAYHCRGWPPKRSNVSYWAKKLSSRNDIRIAVLYYPASIPVYLLKYLYVTTLERGISAAIRAWIKG